MCLDVVLYVARKIHTFVFCRRMTKGEKFAYCTQNQNIIVL